MQWPSWRPPFSRKGNAEASLAQCPPRRTASSARKTWRWTGTRARSTKLVHGPPRHAQRRIFPPLQGASLRGGSPRLWQARASFEATATSSEAMAANPRTGAPLLSRTCPPSALPSQIQGQGVLPRQRWQGMSPKKSTLQMAPSEAKITVTVPTSLDLAEQPQPQARSALALLEKEERTWADTPLWQRLQRRISWWEKHAPPFIQTLIKRGVSAEIPLPPVLSKTIPSKSMEEVRLATEIMLDYQKSGAVRVVSDPHLTKHLIPWFIISKKEPEGGIKNRLIADCRELNAFFQPERFTLENMSTIFQVLKKGWFSAKVDLKDAYFHLPLQHHL